MNNYRFLLCVFLCFIIGKSFLSAQTDSANIRTKSATTIPTKKNIRRDVTIEQPTTELIHTTDSILQKKHNPKLAIGLSAVLPGAGQIYNKKWWKVPIIYAGLAASTYFIYDFGTQTRTFQLEYRNRMQGKTELLNPDFASYSDDNILSLKQYYQRNMEFAIAATTIIYVLNIIDAAVDAHLFYFDISEDLSLQMSPYVAPASILQSSNAGFAFVFQLK